MAHAQQKIGHLAMCIPQRTQQMALVQVVNSCTMALIRSREKKVQVVNSCTIADHRTNYRTQSCSTKAKVSRDHCTERGLSSPSSPSSLLLLSNAKLCAASHHSKTYLRNIFGCTAPCLISPPPPRRQKPPKVFSNPEEKAINIELRGR